ncbi:MAG: NYN domain-containing protein [Acidobacteria bacterium]|nr:NYN domain-containing protein [Acidobacteriota bacterium]
MFIDGQNLYNACRVLFGHPLCHPHLLAQVLAGPERLRGLACRFYTGRPNPNLPGEDIKARNLDRRLAVMRKCGVTVVTRPLRYHWDWGHRERLPKPVPGGPAQTVTLRPWRRPQEKGIDLIIALDVVEFILRRMCDVAIVVSLDRDLYEIPQAVQNLREFVDRRVRLEAAVPVPPGRKFPKILPRFAYTHQITEQVFELIRDDTDYACEDKNWSVPTLPLALPS